jgi:hypothetical protein
MKPFFVSIVGSPGSGKTYFIASMTHRLREILPKVFGLSYTDSQPDLNRTLTEYEEQQFTNPDRESLIKLLKTQEYGDGYQGVTFPGNQVVTFPNPFFFNVRPTVSAEKNSGSDVFQPTDAISNNHASPHVLCLYDNAGESFMPGADTTTHPVARHVAKADALMFLFDPTQVDAVRTALKGKTDDPQVTGEGSTGLITFRHETVLHELAARVRKYAGLGENDKHKSPLIVAVTKYDAWWKLTGLERLPSAWQEIEDGAPCQVNMDVINQMSAGIRKVLLRFSQEFVNAAENFCEQVYYLPVSATGSAPEAGDGDGLSHRPRNINPVWVEVPMLLALSQYCENLIK